MIALDGTKVAANAADRANRTLANLEEQVSQIGSPFTLDHGR